MNAAQSNRTERGSALIVSFVIIVLVGLVCSSMFQYSNQQALFAAKTRDFLKAKVIAEAGVNQAYNKVKFNFAATTNAALFPLTVFGDGTYDVTVSRVGTNKARLVSLGRCGTADATVIADLLNQENQQVAWVTDLPKSDIAVFTNYAVIAGGLIDWGGGGIISNGGLVKANNRISMVGGGTMQGPNLKVFSSQQIYIQGSSRIYGTAYAPTFDGKINQITTRVTQQVPVTGIPSIDLTAYYQRAQAFNQVKSSSYSINSDFSPAGGVLWVNGDLKISNGKCTGCFIATGNIDSSTSQKATTTNGYPLFISRDGNFKITGTPTMQGLIYARSGSIDWSGGGTVNGSIIAAGNFNKAGGSDLVINFVGAPPVIPDIPLSHTNSTDYVIISAWQQ